MIRLKDFIVRFKETVNLNREEFRKMDVLRSRNKKKVIAIIILF